MENLDPLANGAGRPARATIRKIGLADLESALANGIDDFMAMPTHVIFISLIYPIVGLLLARMTFGKELIYLLFPLTVGFAFIGPFAAIGLYEISRRREVGMATSWKDVFDVLRSPSIRAIAALALVLIVIFLGWLAVAHWVYHFVGLGTPDSPTQFISDVLMTSAGQKLILLGSAIGLIFGVIVLSISVVSFPMLLDRNVGARAAVTASISVVLANPLTMALWGLIVAIALVIGSLPFFMGLAVVMPVLGHATWHLYRRVLTDDILFRQLPKYPVEGTITSAKLWTDRSRG